MAQARLEINATFSLGCLRNHGLKIVENGKRILATLSKFQEMANLWILAKFYQQSNTYAQLLKTKTSVLPFTRTTWDGKPTKVTS